MSDGTSLCQLFTCSLHKLQHAKHALLGFPFFFQPLFGSNMAPQEADQKHYIVFSGPSMNLCKLPFSGA